MRSITMDSFPCGGIRSDPPPKPWRRIYRLAGSEQACCSVNGIGKYLAVKARPCRFREEGLTAAVVDRELWHTHRESLAPWVDRFGTEPELT